MNKKGFTLIELLAVIAILAILVVIAMPSVIKVFNTAKMNTFITEVKTISKTNSNEFIKRSLTNKNTSYVSSEDDTALDLSNNRIKYYLDIDIKGNITKYSFSNGEYCVEGTKDIKDLTIEDIIQGDCQNSNQLVATPDSCFVFDKTTGTITNYLCDDYNYNYDTLKILSYDACVNTVGEYYHEHSYGDSTNMAIEDCQNEENLSSSVSRSLIKDLLQNNIISIDTAGPTYLNVVIPELIDGVTVRGIGEMAFSDTSIYTVVLPPTIETIGENAFYHAPFLYNIVNKTGRKFLWPRIVIDRFYNDDETPSMFTILNNRDYYNIYITEEPREKIDLSKIFRTNGNFVEVINTLNYDIYYALPIPYYDLEFLPVELNKKYFKHCDSYVFKIVKNGEIIFNNSIIYYECAT